MKTYRGYIISPVPHSPTLLKVAVEGQGGKIPNVLIGMFTSYTAVTEIVDKYLATKPAQESENVSKARQKG